jgi:hypothetical protein
MSNILIQLLKSAIENVDVAEDEKELCNVMHVSFSYNNDSYMQYSKWTLRLNDL